MTSRRDKRRSGRPKTWWADKVVGTANVPSRHIQVVSGGIVNILEGGSVDFSE